MTGVCPQHNILFDTLSCKEHLRFFSCLKGIPSDRIDTEVSIVVVHVVVIESTQEVSIVVAHVLVI